MRSLGTFEGITKLECVLRECCYNDNSRTCHYPRNYLRAVGNELPYPELLASDAADAECPKVRRYYHIVCFERSLHDFFIFMIFSAVFSIVFRFYPVQLRTNAFA